jgi:Clr5 domain
MSAIMENLTAPSGVPTREPPIYHSHRPLSAQDWEDQRQTFERLYVTERKKLREVMEIMERDHGFLAT